MTDDEEVLVADRPRRRGLVVGALVLVAALGWLVLREPGPLREPLPALLPPVSDAAVEPPAPGPAPSLDQLVFLDDGQHAVALRSDCPLARGQSGVCRRTLLASDNAGRTFAVRGRLPVSADGARHLLAEPGGVLAVVDDQTVSSIVRSSDGGRTWVQMTLADGPPAPLPSHAPALTVPTRDCPERCGDLFWVDVVTATRHALPSQPGGQAGGFWYISPATRDGPIAAVNALGAVAVSVDRGATWTRSDLPVSGGASSGLPVVLVTGSSRVYAFVSAIDARGLATELGFRSDDAGASWIDLDYPSRPVDGVPPQEVPRVALDGEVLATNYRDGVLRSSGGGTAFGEVPGSPEEVRLSQGAADGPVLATRYGTERPTYWLSRDGLTWTPLQLPAG